jgi:pilus assembly protein CpaC
MKVGQTLAIAGLVYNRVEAQNKGLPWLADLPWFGTPFRRVTERNNEVELVILVRPEFAEAMDPCEVPPCGPGQFTTSPTDVELYHRGYLEVPKAGPGGFGPGSCGPGMGPELGPDGLPYGGGIVPQGYEQVQPGMATPINSDTRWPSQNATQSRVAVRPAQPTPAARSTGGRPVSMSISSDSRAIGTSQNPTSRYEGRAPVQKPTPARQPSLIGPLGYDDLK